ncbi:MAG TPA: glycoside hydrolase [Caldilineae bacterium]|nr:glycoside hydrolase [Caldilineae bacterium]
MPSFHITDDRITVEGDIFRVVLDRRLPSLTIWREEEEIWRSGPVFGHARYGDTWLTPHSLEEVELTGEGVRMVARDAGGDEARHLILAVDEQGVTVRWHAVRTPDEWRDTAHLTPAGHWYGQGELFRGVYPLERGLIHADPFITYDNGPDGLLCIQAGVWVTSKGIGIILENDRDIAIGLNRPQAASAASGGPRPLVDADNEGDGLWSITARHQDHLAYRITIGRDMADVCMRHARRLGLPKAQPAAELLRTPQWTTWAWFKDQINQEVVLKFAREILDHGFPAGLFGIDDRWQARYGDTEFDRERFPNPYELIATLQDMGFLVTLWITPFVNPDAENFQEGRRHGYFLRRSGDDEPYLVRWWRGEGALVDFSNPEAAKWWLGKLHALQDRYGVDGFKFDAGEGNFVPRDALSAGDIGQNGYSDAYVAWVAQHFKWCEVRTGWRSQRAPLLFRLWDKDSHWGEENGLRAIIPQTLHLGLAGYPFVFADMIGGNNYGDRKADKELLIRWTELCAALPAMQFSIPPWSFDQEAVAICRRYAELHVELAPAFDQAIQETLKTGAPIIRPLCWRWDDEAAYACADQFLLGDACCVAPVVIPGARSRDVLLPPGVWRDHWTDERLDGPTTLRDYPAPLERLPLFHREG